MARRITGSILTNLISGSRNATDSFLFFSGKLHLGLLRGSAEGFLITFNRTEHSFFNDFIENPAKYAVHRQAGGMLGLFIVGFIAPEGTKLHTAPIISDYVFLLDYLTSRRFIPSRV